MKELGERLNGEGDECALGGEGGDCLGGVREWRDEWRHGWWLLGGVMKGMKE